METATKVEPKLFETETERAVEGIRGLGQALAEGLFGRLAEANQPLAQEAAELRAKAKVLRGKHAECKPRAESRLRILATEIDAALSEGRDDDAEAKRRESEDLTAGLQEIDRQADACEQRVAEIVAQQQQNYRQVFEAAYPRIRESTIATEIALVELLDKTWGDLQRFGQESGLTVGYGPLVRIYHKADLTPGDHGRENVWFGRLREWFGGRR